MRIFVDVGSHEGQTIEEVVKPEWEFDLIYALEPMPREFKILERAFVDDPRVRPFRMALGAFTAQAPMYGTNNELEASLFRHKNDVDQRKVTLVEVMDADVFFRNLPEGDVYVNMNCEGAEFPILTRLIDTGTITRIKHLLVDFDIRKIPGLEGEEENLRSGLDASGISWICEYQDIDDHGEQIAFWLEGVLV